MSNNFTKALVVFKFRVGQSILQDFNTNINLRKNPEEQEKMRKTNKKETKEKREMGNGGR
jgi:hypothetical protein